MYIFTSFLFYQINIIFLTIELKYFFSRIYIILLINILFYMKCITPQIILYYRKYKQYSIIPLFWLH
jgi:hypothetical protein